jgi:hypothetical protein
MVTEEAIKQVKEAAGARDLHQIDIPDGDDEFTLLVVTPSRPEWMKLLSDISGNDDIDKRSKANENFILAVAKWPDRKTIQEFFARKFGTIGKVVDKLSDMVGADAEVRAKKL